MRALALGESVPSDCNDDGDLRCAAIVNWSSEINHETGKDQAIYAHRRESEWSGTSRGERRQEVHHALISAVCADVELAKYF